MLINKQPTTAFLQANPIVPGMSRLIVFPDAQHRVIGYHQPHRGMEPQTKLPVAFRR